MCACARYPHVANVLYIIMMVKTHSRLAQAFPLNMVGEWVGNLAGEMCVISGELALACCLGDCGDGDCPPDENAGSA